MNILERIERAARVAEKMYPGTSVSATFRKFADELAKDDEAEEILNTPPVHIAPVLE